MTLNFAAEYDRTLNVEIYPAPKDVYNTEGLCGVLDGIMDNDLQKADGTLVNYVRTKSADLISYEEFSESWR